MSLFAKFWISYAIILVSGIAGIAYSAWYLLVSLTALLWFMRSYVKDNTYEDEHEKESI